MPLRWNDPGTPLPPQAGRRTAAIALVFNSGYLAWRAYGDVDIRGWLIGLAIVSAVCALAIWTSERWVPQRRSRTY